MQPKVWWPVIAIIIAITLIGGLYLLPSVPPKKSAIESDPQYTKEGQYDLLINDYIAQLPLAVSDILDVGENLPPSRAVSFYDSLSLVFQDDNYILSAHFSYMAAQSDQNNFLLWENSGEIFFDVLDYLQETTEKSIIGNQAISILEYALKLDSTNLGSRIKLAATRVKCGQNPMQGIGELKKINNSYPENIETIYYLGIFSLQSGQLEKAQMRFNSIIAKDSLYKNAWYMLGICNLQQGNTSKGIENLEYYKYLCTDSEEKRFIEQYINEIVKNIKK